MSESRIVQAKPWTMFLTVTACLLLLLLAASGWAERQIGTVRDQLSVAHKNKGENAKTGSRLSNPHPGEFDASLWVSSDKARDGMARLQRRVSGLLKLHRTELIELKAVPLKANDHPTRLRLQLEVQVTPDRLQGLLDGLESRVPLILIDSFQLITADHPSARKTDRQGGLLRLHIELSAFAPAGIPA